MLNFKSILIFLFLLFLPIGAFAYAKHEPILIENIQATADDPYIIEGYEISSDEQNCIEIKNSKNIIVRDNYLHDCNYYTDEYPGAWQEGHSIYAENSENITIENNLVKDNIMGPYVRYSDNVKISGNTVLRSVYQSAIRCDFCQDFEIDNNYLKDNGIPEWFNIPGIRLIGIWAMSSDNGEIHGNTVIASTSDGIAVCGQDYMGNDWTIVSKNIKIYDNVLLENLEQGMWLNRARNLSVFDNTIRTTCFNVRNGIAADFDVADSEFYNNKIVACRGNFISFSMSYDNYIHDNSLYSIEERPSYQVINDSEGDDDKCRWANIPYRKSTGNVFENNTQYLLTGKLAKTLKEKYGLSEELKTYEPKGFEKCEIDEGVVDEECMEKEGTENVGIDSKLIGYSPLMTDFENYVKKKVDGKNFEKEKTLDKDKKEIYKDEKDQDTITEEISESWRETLFIIAVILAIVLLAIYIKRKYKK